MHLVTELKCNISMQEWSQTQTDAKTPSLITCTGVDWVRKIHIFLSWRIAQIQFTGFKGHDTYLSALIETDIDNQTRILVMNSRTLQNGTSLLCFWGNKSLKSQLVMQCARVGRGVDRLIRAYDPHFSYTGPEHSTTAGSGQPSYCTLPLFHPPRRVEGSAHGRGYISNDGHSFNCTSPAAMLQAFHV
jgi:hypothetical protein